MRLLLTLFLVVLPAYPLSIFVIEFLLGSGENTPLRAVRDLFLLFVVGVVFIRQILRYDRITIYFVDVLLLVVLLHNAILAAVGDQTAFLKIFAFRDLSVIYLSYFIGRAHFIKRDHFESLLKYMGIVTGIICLFGIIQPYWPGPIFLLPFRSLDMLFINIAGRDIQRAVGTFSHAPEFAGYLLLILAFVQPRIWEKRIAYIALAVLLLAGILLSFTRSIWIASVVYVGLMILRDRKSTIKILALTQPLVFILLAVTSSYWLSTLSGTENSANYHGETLINSLTYIVDHPLGTGLASGSLRDDGAEAFFEGFWFNILGSGGIQGMLLYLALSIAVIIFLWKEWKARGKADELYRSILSVHIAFLVTGFFLPLFFTREIALTFWFIVGMLVSEASQRQSLKTFSMKNPNESARKKAAIIQEISNK